METIKLIYSRNNEILYSKELPEDISEADENEMKAFDKELVKSVKYTFADNILMGDAADIGNLSFNSIKEVHVELV